MTIEAAALQQIPEQYAPKQAPNPFVDPDSLGEIKDRLQWHYGLDDIVEDFAVGERVDFVGRGSSAFRVGGALLVWASILARNEKFYDRYDINFDRPRPFNGDEGLIRDIGQVNKISQVNFRPLTHGQFNDPVKDPANFIPPPNFSRDFLGDKNRIPPSIGKLVWASQLPKFLESDTQAKKFARRRIIA